MRAEQAEALEIGKPSGCAAIAAIDTSMMMMLKDTCDGHHDVARRGNGEAVAAFAAVCAGGCALAEFPEDHLEGEVAVGADGLEADLPASYAVERRQRLRKALTQISPCMI